MQAGWGRCLNWVYRHLLWCVHPPTARYTWLYKKLPLSQCQVYWTPSLCFTSLWFYAILRAFVLYSHYCYSILNEKLNNGKQTFESMSLLGVWRAISSKNTWTQTQTEIIKSLTVQVAVFCHAEETDWVFSQFEVTTEWQHVSSGCPQKRGLERGQLQTAGNYKIIALCLYGKTRTISCKV